MRAAGTYRVREGTEWTPRGVTRIPGRPLTRRSDLLVKDPKETNIMILYVNSLQQKPEREERTLWQESLYPI